MWVFVCLFVLCFCFAFVFCVLHIAKVSRFGKNSLCVSQWCPLERSGWQQHLSCLCPGSPSEVNDKKSQRASMLAFLMAEDLRGREKKSSISGLFLGCAVILLLYQTLEQTVRCPCFLMSCPLESYMPWVGSSKLGSASLR